VKSSWYAQVAFVCGGILPSTKFVQLSSAGRAIKSDVWQVHEWLIDVGDIGQANGTFTWWIDGKLVVDKRGHKFRTQALPHGVYRWKWAPTWGGVGGVKTRADDYQVDDIYVSSYGKP
jgi:hypothetical protein